MAAPDAELGQERMPRRLPGALTIPEDRPSPAIPNLASDSSSTAWSNTAAEQASGGWNIFATPTHRNRLTTAAESTPLVGLGSHFVLPPEDSVYSYFLFMPPIDQRRTKRHTTPLIAFGFVLVLINFVMQTGLLLVVGNHIMLKQNQWMSSMVHIKHHAWYHIVPMPYNYPAPACRGLDETICVDKGDGISCAPASIHVLTDWDLLDSDGDGVWSREEARNKKLRETVQCDYGVDLLALYHRFSHQLNASDVLQGRRGTELLSGSGINKAYYNWFLHKPLLCQYGDADMCGSLFQRGFFDEALRQRPSPEFTDTTTSLQYCTKLLQTECFDILPTTYKVWRSREKQQCGERLFGQSMYQVPESAIDDDDSDSSGAIQSVPMLTIGFTLQNMYAGTKGYPFRIFLCILLVTFLSVMFLECRSIMKCFVWTYNFPKDHEAGTDGNVVGRRAVRIELQKDSGGSDNDGSTPRHHNAVSKSISAVRNDHRLFVGFITLLRFFLWVFLLWSGIMFLTGKPRYMTLVFDALSLLFIFEIDELLYTTMLRHELKQDHLSTDEIHVKYPARILSGRKMVLMDMLLFFGIILFALCIVYTYCVVELDPLIDAITCLCSKDGPHCHDAQHFSKSWWDDYWSTTLPAANLIIDRLKDA